MGISIDAIGNNEENNVSLDNLQEIKADKWDGDFDPNKTDKVARENITPDTPNASTPSLAGRVHTSAVQAELEKEEQLRAKINTYIDAVENHHEAINQLPDHSSFDNVKEASSKIDSLRAQILDFPNLANEAVKAGLEKERQTNAQINKHIAQIETHQKNIDLLLDFNAALTSYKDSDEASMAKVTTLCNELQTRGIDFGKTEDLQLSKDKIAELKSLANGFIDKERSNVQIIFSTKVQSLVQSVSAIMEALKEIIRNNTRLINTANRLPGH